MKFIFLISAYIISVFSFSQIVYPILFALPYAKSLERFDLLKEKIPSKTFYSPPIIWTIIICISIFLVARYFENYLLFYCIGLFIGLVTVIVKMPSQRETLKEDFMNTWGSYIKENSK